MFKLFISAQPVMLIILTEIYFFQWNISIIQSSYIIYLYLICQSGLEITVISVLDNELERRCDLYCFVTSYTREIWNINHTHDDYYFFILYCYCAVIWSKLVLGLESHTCGSLIRYKSFRKDRICAREDIYDIVLTEQ